jgi:hypothetical protein
MRSIINYCLWVVLCIPVLSAAQEEGEKKCATFDRFTANPSTGVNGKITAVMVRPSLPLSILSPSGRFRIHYDSTSSEPPALLTAAGVRIPGTAKQYVDTVARIFDSVWTAEVTTYGFPAPPSDNGEGGGDEYDIYIAPRVTNDFGQTNWLDETALPGTGALLRYPSYIDIDNDYAGYRTPGLKGLMSTAAHEFHHAIQIGCYGVWDEPEFYFYELSAESMEPTVFPSSNDYTKDIKTYFSNVENISLYAPHSSYAGYERAIWGVFLMKRYGVGIMRQIWESIATMRPVPAEKAVLEKNGTSLGKEFSEFCYWNYFTGYRGDSVKYYRDAKAFPLVSIREREPVGSSATVYQQTCKGFGVNYLQGIRASDTAAFIITNVNMDDALGTQAHTYGYQLQASTATVSGGAQIANGWYTNFSVTDPANWKYTPVVNAAAQLNAAIVCFPNPYRPAEASLYIGPINLATMNKAPEFAVFTSGYDRVYSGTLPLQSYNGSTYAVWDGKNSSGDLVASGIYIYWLTTGDPVATGKFAVVR